MAKEPIKKPNKLKRVIVTPEEMQRLIDKGIRKSRLDFYADRPSDPSGSKYSIFIKELTIDTKVAKRKLSVWFMSLEAEENDQLLHLLHSRNQ
jgi:hypothetical protein